MDKRKYKRYIFPNDESLIVNLNLSGKSSSSVVEARLLNVSEGGLGLAVAREQINGVKVDSKLILGDLENVPQLQALKETQLKVRWVLDHDPLENLGIGCEFINLSEGGKDEIYKLINSGMLKVSQ